MSALLSPVARAVDGALEATIAGSFTTVGYHARKALFDWEDLENLDLAGRVILVTGATSGLGLASATRLAERGADVVVLGRDPDRTRATAARISEAAGNGTAVPLVADLSSLADVRAAAADVPQRFDRLDALINNAGALTHRHTRTEDGLELTYQTHVVAPYLLTELLMPLLRATPGSRVVTVSSGGMYAEPLDLSTLQMAEEGYDGVRAYARAKRAQVLLNQEWAQRQSGGPVFHAMHPGWADTPGVVEALPGFHRVVGPFLRTPQEGADTMQWLATADEPLDSSGRFWLDRRPRGIVKLPHTRTDGATRQALWEKVRADAGLDA